MLAVVIVSPCFMKTFRLASESTITRWRSALSFHRKQTNLCALAQTPINL